MSTRRDARRRPTRRVKPVTTSRTWVPLAALVAVAVAAVIGLAVYLGGRSDGDHPVPAATTSDGLGLVTGDGPVTVEVWLDFHCPHCRAFEEESAQVLADYLADGVITLVQHPISILDRASSTRYSTRSAAATGCAADAGVHHEYAAALLAAQPPQGGAGLSDEQLIEIGRQVGATGEEFAACVDEQRYEGWVEDVTEGATRAGVTGTPTVAVNGQRIPATRDALVTAVEAARANG